MDYFGIQDMDYFEILDMMILDFLDMLLEQKEPLASELRNMDYEAVVQDTAFRDKEMDFEVVDQDIVFQDKRMDFVVFVLDIVFQDKELHFVVFVQELKMNFEAVVRDIVNNLLDFRNLVFLELVKLLELL